MRLIIDRDGTVWSAYDESLVERWGYPDPDFDLPSFAVRNLGAIDLLASEKKVRINFRWLTVKAEALESALRLLDQFRGCEIIISSSHGDTWTETAFESPEDAASWIEENRAHSAETTRRSMATRPRALNSLSARSLSRLDDPEDRLALMFKKWRLARGVFDEDVTSFLIRFGLFDRTVIVAESSSQDLVFGHSGTGFALYDSHDKSWNFRAQGTRVVDQPDPEFGRWIDRTYRSVLDEAQPRFEQVDAVIQARGADPYRFWYHRLLLPWNSPSGQRILTGSSYNERADRFVQQ